VARIETSIEIDRPIASVWDYLTDLHNAKDWSTEVLETVYSGPLRLGATGVDTRRWGNREVNWNWEVTGFDPPHLLALTYGPPLNAVAKFNFEATSIDTTRVSCTTDLKPSGWWRFLTPILVAEGRKADQTQFAKVKAILEQQPDSPASEAGESDPT
jgi:uncharacterized protein YndB with AHSA1/START domain